MTRARVADVRGLYGDRSVIDARRSPLTQTFGLGMFEPAGDETIDLLEVELLEQGLAVGFTAVAASP